MKLTVPTTDPEARPSEAGHWYTNNGDPRYEVERADGKGMRSATLRDARKAGEGGELWVPSVTTLTNLIKGGALIDWWGRHVAETALALEDATVDAVLEKASEKAATARDKGIEIHAWVEAYYRGEPVPEEGKAVVEAVAAKLDETFGSQLWVAEKSFAHPDGYGGKVDLYFIPKNLRSQIGNRLMPHGAVVDVKTADFGPGTSPKRYAYPDRGIQLAMYAYGLGIPMARLANVIVSTNADLEKPLVLVYDWGDENHRWLHAGLALLDLWKHLKSYDGSW